MVERKNTKAETARSRGSIGLVFMNHYVTRYVLRYSSTFIPGTSTDKLATVIVLKVINTRFAFFILPQLAGAVLRY